MSGARQELGPATRRVLELFAALLVGFLANGALVFGALARMETRLSAVENTLAQVTRIEIRVPANPTTAQGLLP